MKSKQLSRLSLVILSLIIFSCKKVQEPTLIGPNYFPIKIGNSITYQVNTIDHNAFLKKSDTISYLQKETYQSSFIDNVGDTVYKMAIDQSNDNGISWVFQNYVIISKDNYSVQRIEEDNKRVVLSFPFKIFKSWDANAYNITNYQRARYTAINESYAILQTDSEFKKTTTIDLGDSEDPFFKFYEKEVYAEGIGLIEKELIDIETQIDKYKDGYVYKKTFINSNY